MIQERFNKLMKTIGGEWYFDKMNHPLAKREKTTDVEEKNKNLFRHQKTIFDDQRHQMYLSFLEWVNPQQKIDDNEDIHPLSVEYMNKIKELNKRKRGRSKLSDCHWMAHSNLKQVDYRFDSTFTGSVPNDKNINLKQFH